MEIKRDVMGAKGSLYLKVVKRDGTVVPLGKIDNLIVLQGRNNMAKLLGGNTGMHITHVGVGTGNNPALSTDIGITDPILVEVFQTRIGTGLEAEDGSVYDDARTVQFHFRVGLSIANDIEIWEYGLYAADGTLCSRIVRNNAYVKDPTDQIVGFWQVQF